MIHDEKIHFTNVPVSEHATGINKWPNKLEIKSFLGKFSGHKTIKVDAEAVYGITPIDKLGEAEKLELIPKVANVVEVATQSGPPYSRSAVAKVLVSLQPTEPAAVSHFFDLLVDFMTMQGYRYSYTSDYDAGYPFALALIGLTANPAISEAQKLDFLLAAPGLIHSPVNGTYQGHCIEVAEETIDEFLEYATDSVKFGFPRMSSYGLKYAVAKLADRSNTWGHDCDYSVSPQGKVLASELLDLLSN